MEIRPILSAMMRNKTGAVLIALQIAFTLAVIVNALFIIYQRWEKVNRPSGMDTANIIAFASQWAGRDLNYRQEVEADLRALRQLPGVRAVTPTGAIPLSGGGWGGALRLETSDNAPRTSTGLFAVDHNALAALGLNLVSGRTFTADEVLWRDTQSSAFPASIIVSQAMAEALFPDEYARGESALGKTVYSNDTPTTIIGIVERMHGSWVSWDGLERTVLVPTVDTSDNYEAYLVRSDPGQADALIPQIEAALHAVNPRRVINRMRTLAEYAEDSYRDDTAMIWMLLTVVALLVVITTVGIVGLAAFSVTQRTRQIGTRRALGARRQQILRYFLVENGLITSIGLALGVVLATAFNYWLVTHFELERLDWFYVPGGMALLWILGVLAVYGPARRASRVSPAIATRTV